MKSIEILLLSRQDIVQLDLQPRTVVEQIKKALLEHAAGTYEMHPKIGIHPTGTDPANFIHAMPAYLRQMEACGMKWVGGFAQNFRRELPNVTGLQVVNDPATGIPLAVMDCSYLTGLRTSAVSTLAAIHCAHPQARTLALVGCGFEGTMHAVTLTALMPELTEVRLRDIRPAAMEALRDRLSASFTGKIVCCTDDESCLIGADVICTCTNGEQQIVQAEWFQPGACGVAIEGGCAYTAAALHQADKFLVDDIPLAEYFDRLGRDRKTADGDPDPEFPGGMPSIYATIGQVVAGQLPARTASEDRIICVPIGMAICDIALGQLVLQRATERQLGQRFRLS